MSPIAPSSTRFIVSRTPEHARLIRTAREINDAKPGWVLEKVRAAVGGLLQAKPDRSARQVTVACYGLAYKPDIDDLRESPAMAIVRALGHEHPGRVLAVEPNISGLPDGMCGVELTGLGDALSQADVHVVLVAHKPFTDVDWAGVGGEILDLQGITGR